MFIVAIFILGWITMLLWNALIPELFHGPVLDYWHAVGLLILTRILVGIRGRRGLIHGLWHWRKWGPPWSWRKRGWRFDDAMRGPDYCGPWQGGWQHWQNMTPEEREKAKADWKYKKEEWKSSWKQGE